MCEKRTKQLSDFQNFVDNLDENMDELESRELSDEDNRDEFETLSEQSYVDYKKDMEDSRTIHSDEAIEEKIEAEVIGPNRTERKIVGPSLSDAVTQYLDALSDEDYPNDCISDDCSNKSHVSDDFCEACIIRLYRDSTLNQY